MSTLIQLRRGTAAEWAATNPVLAEGEPGVNLNTGEQRIGDGVRPWSDLPSSGGVTVVEYQMPAPATTVTIDHGLGHDPVAVQVFDGGVLCDEYNVTFTLPGQQVQIGFDSSVAALIRLL